MMMIGGMFEGVEAPATTEYKTIAVEAVASYKWMDQP
jgi:hypothetical protein